MTIEAIEKANNPEGILILQGAPTLAGIKTASLFRYPCASVAEARCSIRRINHILVPKGIIAIPMRYQEGNVLLYIYRPASLTRDFKNKKVQRLLKKLGYPCHSVSRCVATLYERFKTTGEFPHEIGFFLGYPPEDVEGFICNKACNCKCTGYWKVYGNPKKAKQRFALYEKCTDLYMCQYSKGKHLQDLAVCIQ